jgi:hypothetical protein
MDSDFSETTRDVLGLGKRHDGVCANTNLAVPSKLNVVAVTNSLAPRAMYDVFGSMETISAALDDVSCRSISSVVHSIVRVV